MKISDLSFSQAVLSMMVSENPSTISRLVSKFDLKPCSVDGRKKYSFLESRRLLTEIIANKYEVKDKVQAFYNFKGGTGKTTLCYQMSVHMALFGFKVLVIDCDPQAHLTYVLGVEQGEEKNTLYDIMINNLNIKHSIKNICSGLDLIPSDLSVTRIEIPLNQQTSREKVIKNLIKPIRDQYDFIFLDTNPTISTLNQNATYAAEVINIVCETQPFSLEGLNMLVTELQSFFQNMEYEIPYRIIPNKYESKTATSQEVLGALRYKYGDLVMESIVRKCEDLNISAKMQLPLCALKKPRSIGFEDMCDLSLDILQKSSTKIS